MEINDLEDLDRVLLNIGTTEVALELGFEVRGEADHADAAVEVKLHVVDVALRCVHAVVVRNRPLLHRLGCRLNLQLAILLLLPLEDPLLQSGFLQGHVSFRGALIALRGQL